MSFRLYVLQRLTAIIMAPLIAVHLVVIFYATNAGLSAGAILARTRGSIFWALFYGIFVVAAALHGAIGLRNVFAEWGPENLRRNPALLACVLAGVAIILLVLGLRAVYAVVHI